MKLLATLMLVAASIHVVEEARSGWLEWARGFGPRVTKGQFWVVNAIFLALCGAAVAVPTAFFALVIASVLFVNAWIHVLPTLVQRKRSPGVLSAVALYMPLSVVVLWRGMGSGLVGKALLCGVVLMAVPFVGQWVRMMVGGRR